MQLAHFVERTLTFCWIYFNICFAPSHRAFVVKQRGFWLGYII